MEMDLNSGMKSCLLRICLQRFVNITAHFIRKRNGIKLSLFRRSEWKYSRVGNVGNRFMKNKPGNQIHHIFLSLNNVENTGFESFIGTAFFANYGKQICKKHDSNPEMTPNPDISFFIFVTLHHGVLSPLTNFQIIHDYTTLFYDPGPTEWSSMLST